MALAPLSSQRVRDFALGASRWFAVTLLVSLVHTGVLASVLPRGGVVAFCAVVVLTMLAAEAFDPRLMWDAAGANEERPVKGEA